MMLDHVVVFLLALMIIVLITGMITAIYWMITYIIDDINERRFTHYQERHKELKK